MSSVGREILAFMFKLYRCENRDSMYSLISVIEYEREKVSINYIKLNKIIKKNYN